MFIANLKRMILDCVISILINLSTGVLGNTSSRQHYSFVPFNGEMVICCIMMHMTNLMISKHVLKSAIGIFIKLDHVGTNQAFANVTNGIDVFHSKYKIILE